MSVVGEVVGVVACIVSVISAYHDGGAMVQRIKLKRAEKREPAPPRLLEESIDQAPEEIEKEKQRGINRFGKAFEDGDHRTVIALQQIMIQLQGSLLVKLREASYHDEAVDFTSLIDAADLGRDRTIGVLLELRQRLLQAAPIGQMSVSNPYQTLTSEATYVSVQTGSGLSQEPPLAPTSATVQRRVSEEKQPAGETNATAGAHDSRQSRQHRQSSFLRRFKHQRTHSGLSDLKLDEGRIRQSASVQSVAALKSPPTDTARQHFTYEDGEDNSFEIWGKPTRDDQFTDTLSTSYNTLASATVPNLFSSPHTMRHVSTIPSRGSIRAASASSLQPNPGNNYLGFCKGAARLQNGDRKGMQKTKEFNDGWSHSTVYYLSCSNSKCVFSGHMDLEVIWTKVWDLCNEKGLKFRWTFLAKSHVCQNKVKNQHFAYQCLFCVFLGNQPPVIHSTDLYLDHVSQEHRGRKLGDVVLYRTCCVNDRVCEDSEEFDINLFPLTAIEGARLRKQSEVFSDDLIVGPPEHASNAQDSMFSNEPWNEGLSEFQFTDEYEHGGALSLRSFRSNSTG